MIGIGATEIVMFGLLFAGVVLLVPTRTRRIGQRLLWLQGVLFALAASFVFFSGIPENNVARNIGRALPAAALCWLLYYTRSVWRRAGTPPTPA